MIKIALPLLAGFLGVSIAYGQSDLLPVGQYPQFRTLSGLPGAGFGIRPDGSPNFDGAMSFSTPIGYGLSDWHIAMDTANTSDYGFFRFIHTGKSLTTRSIGKAYFMVGVPMGKFGSMSIAYWIISSQLDQALNFQWQLPIHWRNVGVSLGVQDYNGHVGTGADQLPGGDYKSQSWYGAVTVPLPHGIYASAGWGGKRWQKGFVNVSVPLGSRWKATVEHDGFNFNFGAAYDMKLFPELKAAGRPVQTTMMVGFVRAKYAFWSININF